VSDGAQELEVAADLAEDNGLDRVADLLRAVAWNKHKTLVVFEKTPMAPPFANGDLARFARQVVEGLKKWFNSDEAIAAVTVPRGVQLKVYQLGKPLPDALKLEVRVRDERTENADTRNFVLRDADGNEVAP
jgi:hypothetical protein